MDDNEEAAAIGLRWVESIIILGAALGCWYFVEQSNFGGAAFAALVAICVALQSGALIIAAEIRRQAKR